MEKPYISVSKPRGSVAAGLFVLTATVTGAVEGECFYSLPLEYRGWVDEESSNCFLTGLLFTAMHAGCELRLEGCVSEKLLFRVREYLMPMLYGFFDGTLSKVPITVGATTDVVYDRADVVGTGFSGGIDSFHTIIRRGVDERTPAAYRVNTLFFFNVGAHGMGEDPERLAWIEEKFKARWETLQRFPGELGMPYIRVNSNVHKFHQCGHLQTSTLASLSAALFMGRKIKLYYLASLGFNYQALYKNADSQGYDIEVIEDYLVPHICTETFEAISDGSDSSRPEKTRLVAAYEPARRYLNVCGSPDTINKNCSGCYKCKRTMLTLDIFGLLDRFGDVFDLKRFETLERKRFSAEILNNRKRDMFLNDLYQLAAAENYNLRGKTDLWTRLYMAFSETRLCAKLRKIKKSLGK